MKILYVTTISNTVNAFFIPHIKMLIDQGHRVDVAFNIEHEVKPELLEMGCKVHVLEFKRSPLSKDNYTAYKRLKRVIQDEEYDLVHTHTPIASACVRLACRRMRKVRVFYTAHGFHFYKGAPIINWLIYYPVEHFLARYTDTLITINKEDYERARKSFKADRIEYLPGVGIDVERFSILETNKILKRKELGIPEDAVIVLSVGEINNNKNHEIIIRSLAKLNNYQIQYLICGQGPLESYLKNLIKELKLDKQVHLLGFRKDIAEVCKASDIFAFPSKREGLGLAALEAMAAGLPIITSNVHGIVDYSINGETGFSCNPTDLNGFTEAIRKLFDSRELRIEMGLRNKEIVKKYDINFVKNALLDIYK